MKKVIVILLVIGTIFLVSGGFFILKSNDYKGDSNIIRSDSNKEIIELQPTATGPGGCIESQCNDYCRENQEECELWCEKNPRLCQELITSWGDNQEQPQEDPSRQNSNGFREGDGVWEKLELTFYIKDDENALTNEKRKIIQDVFFSKKQSDGGYWGWNSALLELNRLYPENIVPDKFTEVDSEDKAEFVISVFTQKEYCCDLGGEPVRGLERSTIDSNSIKIKSKIGLYNIVDAEPGFLGDVARHEVGHGLGLFGHVTDRNNDLMSLISPDSEIKKPNLEDLYVKYRDKIIETVEETRQKDLEIYDKKVDFPS